MIGSKNESFSNQDESKKIFIISNIISKYNEIFKISVECIYEKGQKFRFLESTHSYNNPCIMYIREKANDCPDIFLLYCGPTY